MNIIVVIFLIINTALLLHINSKIPPRDHIKEALERDQKIRDEKERERKDH